MFTRSVSPEDAPDKPTYIEIEYEKGDPVAIGGRRLSPATLLTNLNKVAGDNGGPRQPWDACRSRACFCCQSRRRRARWDGGGACDSAPVRTASLTRGEGLEPRCSRLPLSGATKCHQAGRGRVTRVAA